MLKRQKSIISEAASISAWNAVFDWPSIVAALIVGRHVVASSSAARSITAARSSKAQLPHSRLRLGGARRSPAARVPVRRLVLLGEDVAVIVRHDRRARSCPCGSPCRR